MAALTVAGVVAAGVVVAAEPALAAAGCTTTTPAMNVRVDCTVAAST